MGKEIDIQAPIRYGEVEFDSSGNPARVVLREVPVEPLTDDKIASLPLRERAKILQDMQTAYTRPQLKQQFHYDLEHVDPTTFHLAATIVDLKDKQAEFNRVRDQRNTVKAVYEAEKQAIRRGERGGRRIEQKVDEAATSWQKQDESLAQKEKTRRVLKDTTVDIFIRDLFLQENGLSKLLLATEDLVSQSSFTRDNILFLLQQASLRLRSRESHEDAALFKYKDGTDNFIQVTEAKLLRQVVETAFSEPASNNPITWQLKQTAIDLLDFYWKNYESIFKEDEKTPLLALSYDFFYSSYLSGDFNLITKAIDYTWSRLKNKRILAQLEHEYKESIRLSDELAPAIVEEIQRDHKQQASSMASVDFFYKVDPQYLQKWDPVKRQCFFNKHHDRWFAISAVSKQASSWLNMDDHFTRWFNKLDQYRLNRESRSILISI